MKSPLTIGMTAENQWALLFNILRKEIRIIRIIMSEMICFFTVTIQRIIFLSRLRRVIEFTRFARKEIFQIFTNKTNIYVEK